MPGSGPGPEKEPAADSNRRLKQFDVGSGLNRTHDYWALAPERSAPTTYATRPSTPYAQARRGLQKQITASTRAEEDRMTHYQRSCLILDRYRCCVAREPQLNLRTNDMPKNSYGLSSIS
jgi:hypothetical protein